MDQVTSTRSDSLSNLTSINRHAAREYANQNTMATNTVYVITGGNRGIGLGLVKSLLARPSTTVIASVRNREAAASLEAEDVSLGAGSQLHVAILDFSLAMPPAEMLEAIEAATAVDHIDVLINNAGSCPPMSIATQTSAEDMRAAFKTNTIAPLMVFQALWPLLQRAKTGASKVIMVTSTVGGIGYQEPLPGGAYGPSKAALKGGNSYQFSCVPDLD